MRGGETFVLVSLKDAGCSYWLTQAERVLQRERWQEELLREILDERVSLEWLQCDKEEAFLLVSRKDAGCSYWLTQAGRVLQRERWQEELL